MPTVINGIGTWYYGKRRIHSRKGACAFCGKLATLESYDTTLFFVVVFVPVIPLARRRILEQCSVCKRHRVLSLAKWEETKLEQGTGVIDALEKAPHDRVALQNAMAFVHAYQDEPLFEHAVEPLALERKDDAAIQAQLGDLYGYFSRWDQAEAAYRASLAVEDNPVVREALAWVQLKQGRPRDAWPFLRHIVDNKNRESAGQIYYLVKGYQAAGLHDEALEIMDARDEAFPDYTQLKDYVKQRQLSTRYRGTDKKIHSSFLDEQGKTGYRQGTWTARLPRWIAALVLIGALVLYFGSALWIGLSRKVFLANGTNHAYTVSLAGHDVTLAPRGTVPVRVAEGEVRLVFKGPGLEPLVCRIESSFWSRPFANHTFVINPDCSAVIVTQEVEYAAGPVGRAPPPRPQVHFGQVAYAFSGLDYEFQDFPATVPVKQGQTVIKTRVALVPQVAPEARLGLMMHHVPGPEQDAFCQRVLRLDPEQSVFLYWLSSHLPPEQMGAFLSSRLDERPILVEWHRAYQSLMDRAHPDEDLRPRYRKLVAETKSDPEALYLLGRVEPDWKQSEALYQQAVQGDRPSGNAMYSLGYRALCAGQFSVAASWFQKALKHMTDQSLTRRVYYEALMADGKRDELLGVLRKDAEIPGLELAAAYETAKVYAIRGDRDKARAALTRRMGPDQSMENQLDLVFACAQNDVATFLKASRFIATGPSFEMAFLQGDLKQAVGLVDQPPHNAIAYHALAYLAAARGADKSLADSQWKTLLEEMRKAGREERSFADLLEGRKPLGGQNIEQIVIDPKIKRVLLAVLAERNPDKAASLRGLARRLDYERDAISLCLRKALGEVK